MYEDICKELDELSGGVKKLSDKLKETETKVPENLERRMTLFKVALGFSVACCIAAFVGFGCWYAPVLRSAEIGVPIDSVVAKSIYEGLPNGMELRNDSLFTRKYIGVEGKQVLLCMVDKNDSTVYPTYARQIDHLAYMSDNVPMKTWWQLVFLTLSLVVMGCCARSFFDYIGNKCYKKLTSESMSIWWPWYLFRLLICAPIASFIIVASRCALFSALFTSTDLNTYLVISFLSGYAMMDFLDMLRSTSKGIFGKER